MTAIETVGLLNSFNTLLNDDSTFGRFESRLTNFGSGVLFSDMMTKPEFDISGTSGTATITSGEAIITTTRATSSPITGKKTPVRYQLSDTKTLTGLVSGSKIYIEIDQTLVDNPTLIQDTYPSTDYANGLNIGTLTHATSRPTTNTYIPLWELSGVDWTWTDLRDMPKIKGNRIDFVDVDGNISTEGNITAQDIIALGDMNATSSYANEFYTPNGGVQEQINTINTSLGITTKLSNEDYLAGESIIKGDSLYPENNLTLTGGNSVVDIVINPTSNYGNSNQSYGMKYTVLSGRTIYVKSVTKVSNCTATRALLKNNAGTLLQTANFVGNVATFSTPYVFLSTESFRVECDNNGSNYNCYYVNKSNITGLNVSASVGSYNGADDNNYFTNLSSITTDDFLVNNFKNIGDVAGNTRVARYDISSGVFASTFKAFLKKFVSPSSNLNCRLQAWNGADFVDVDAVNAVATVAPGSIATTGGEITMTWTGTFTAPVRGTPIRYVFYAGTYGSETVNGTNYYAIGYGPNHTTTRYGKLWNGSAWGSADGKFYYISSNLGEGVLLSKTSASYTYKLPDIPRIATDSYGAGELVKYDFQGITKALSGLTKDSLYYVSDTPGALSTSAGANTKLIGKALDTTKLYLYDLLSPNL